MPAKLIINADDFGFSSSVNSAVLKARRDGVLTSASLMVAGYASKEAVSIAKDDPGLAVGLHLTLSRDKSVLPKTRIPDIVDEQSCFNSDPMRASLNYFFNPKAKEQLKSEIEAQFQAFADTGLKLSHIDGHQHLHAHPIVLPIVIELAKKYGASGIRIPYDPILANFRTDRSRLLSKIVVASGHAYLACNCRRLLRGSKLGHCDIAIGSLMSGNMSDDYLMKMLSIISASNIELFFHPSDAPQTDIYGPNPNDLAALLSPKLKDFIENNGYELTNYAGLREASGECS